MGALSSRLRNAILATALIAPVLAASTPAIANAAGELHPTANSPWIDTSDRAAVLDAYRAEFDRVEPNAGFTGNVSACVAGTTSPEFRQSVVQRINWYRRMAGLDLVSDRSDYNAAAQQTALMMAAQGSLSHSPGPSWACNTASGTATASKSNLALGTYGISSIDAYIRDSGSNNLEMGHRRTILYPELLQIGTGDVPSGGGTWGSNALQVFDDNLWGTRPAVRQPEGFVAWPPAGYVPPQAVWGRWTFSLGGADFTNATVSVANGAGPVPTTVLARRQSSSPNGRIAPEPTIVWSIGVDNGSALLPAPTSGDECYDITVGGVLVAGVQQPTYLYSTCVIDPNFTAASVSPVGPGPAVPTNTTCVNSQFSGWTKPCWLPSLAQNRFVDVARAWQVGPVNWLVANGITTGVSSDSFDPEAALTRAQAATLLWRLAGSPAPPANATSFEDVPVGSWYHDAVQWMAASNITTGTGPGRFSPNSFASRAELVTFLWRMVDSPPTSGANVFSDVVASWQLASVKWASATGITTGTSNTTFAPDALVTRGQAAAFLARFAAALSA